MARMPKAIDDRLKALDRLLKDKRPRSEPELRAIRRQIDDLRTGAKRGLIWDETEAARAVAFFPLLQHWKGPLAKQPFRLEPWQEHCVIAPLFGWYRERPRAAGGVRRFRQAYVEIPRKNGKTILASGVGNFMFMADREEGADIFAAATKRDQAKILWTDAQKTLSAALKRLVTPNAQAIEFKPLNAIFKPLSKDFDSLDGLNPHCALIDELHAHKDRGTFDVLESALGARTHPLLLSITTAGFNKSGICFEQRKLVLRILAGLVEHDAYFGFVTAIDPGDDWTSPKIWHKANPNLGVSINVDTLADLNKTARESPNAENNFRCKRLNEWTAQEVRWCPMEHWERCVGPVPADAMLEQLRGRTCYGGLDIASTRDLASLVLVFPPQSDAERWRVLAWFWCPEAAVSKRAQQDRQGYAGWVKTWVTATEGNSIDQSAIRATLWQLRDQYDLRAVAFDPHNMTECYQQLLREGWPADRLFEFRQSASAYNEPMKKFLDLIRDEDIEHGDNPVLSWNFENLSVKTDHNGNIKPDKEKSQDKIDGACAFFMGLGVALAPAAAAEPARYYDTNPLEVF